MLKIKKSSWHYRLWAFTHEHPERVKPTNLCRYFWRIFFTITLPAALIVAALIGIGALLWVMFQNPVPTLIVLGSIALFLGFIFFAAWQERHRKRKRAARALIEPDPEPKDPNPFTEFLKARKQKVCPLIEVVDDTK